MFGKKDKEKDKEIEMLRKKVNFLECELRCRINEIKELREKSGKPWDKHTDDIMDNILGTYKQFER